MKIIIQNHGLSNKSPVKKLQSGFRPMQSAPFKKIYFPVVCFFVNLLASNYDNNLLVYFEKNQYSFSKSLSIHAIFYLVFKVTNGAFIQKFHKKEA